MEVMGLAVKQRRIKGHLEHAVVIDKGISVFIVEFVELLDCRCKLLDLLRWRVLAEPSIRAARVVLLLIDDLRDFGTLG